MTDEGDAWPHDCHVGIELAIAEFRRRLPGWWYSLGECQVSCDASCAPTGLTPDIGLIPSDARFDSGFHADLRQPSTLAAALRTVMHEALIARVEPGRARFEATFACVGAAAWADGAETLVPDGMAARFIEELSHQHGVEIADWRMVSEEMPLDDADTAEREARVVISVPVEDGQRLFSDDGIVADYALRQAEMEE